MIKQDDMENMTNKTLKQINTNIVPQNNVPMVPEHLQTQNMMRPVVSPPTLPGVVPPPPPPNANFNPYQGGMGNQMGTYPLAQTERTGDYYSRNEDTDYSNVSSDKVAHFEKNRKINKIRLQSGDGPNLDSIVNVGGSTSNALTNYYKGNKWKTDTKRATTIYNTLSQDEKDKL